MRADVLLLAFVGLEYTIFVKYRRARLLDLRAAGSTRCSTWSGLDGCHRAWCAVSASTPTESPQMLCESWYTLSGSKICRKNKGTISPKQRHVAADAHSVYGSGLFLRL